MLSPLPDMERARCSLSHFEAITLAVPIVMGSRKALIMVISVLSGKISCLRIKVEGNLSIRYNRENKIVALFLYLFFFET